MKRQVLTNEQIKEVEDLYKSGEISVYQIACQYKVSIGAINTVIKNSFENKLNGNKFKMKIKDEKNQRKIKIDNHIKEYLKTDEDILKLFDNLRGNRFATNLMLAEEAVDGVVFLCNYDEVDEFLKKIGCNLTSNENNNYFIYKRLIAKRLVFMYEKILKNKSKELNNVKKNKL